jgi:hypothetical protein
MVTGKARLQAMRTPPASAQPAARLPLLGACRGPVPSAPVQALVQAGFWPSRSPSFPRLTSAGVFVRNAEVRGSTPLRSTRLPSLTGAVGEGFLMSGIELGEVLSLALSQFRGCRFVRKLAPGVPAGESLYT